MSPGISEIVTVTGMSNRAFLEAYAQPGRVGLSGGNTLIDKAIARAERHVDDAGRWSLWSHSFLFEAKMIFFPGARSSVS